MATEITIKEKGFTLIELVIVLAIAALVIAAVLLAVGGAQRSQRDSNRKNVAGRLSTAVQNFASNNNGRVTGFNCGNNYCNNLLDPDSGATPIAGTTPNGAANGVEYSLGTLCPGHAGASATRSYAIYYWSENANAVQCTDNF